MFYPKKLKKGEPEWDWGAGEGASRVNLGDTITIEVCGLKPAGAELDLFVKLGRELLDL